VINLPFKFPRIFYGWWIVGACFLLALYIGGVVFFGFTAIFEPIASEFGWSYAQISFAASLRGLETGLLSPFVGILVDRWGPRRLIFGGIVTTGLGLIILSRTTSLGMFYGAFALLAIGVSAGTTVVMMTAVANWFRKKVGIAAGITASGFGFGGLLIPVMVRLIDVYEWRTAMLVLALGLFVIGIPLSLIIRHKPERYGYLPDGEKSKPMRQDKDFVPPPASEEAISVRQALKSRTFWHITLAMTFHVTVVMAVLTHVMPYLSEIGISRSTSGFIAAAIPMVSVAGRLTCGWFGDRLDKRWLAAGNLSMVTLGLLCFEYASAVGAWLLVPFLIIFGVGYGGNVPMRVSLQREYFGYGGNVPMRVSLQREYFGRGNFGTIHGFMLGIVAAGSISGPPLAGWIFDHWGSYQGTWLLFVAIAILGAVMVVTTPPFSARSRMTGVAS
jgi:sugar phosphate permease